MEATQQRSLPLKAGLLSISLLPFTHVSHAAELPVTPTQPPAPVTSSGALLQQYRGMLAPDANARTPSSQAHGEDDASSSTQGGGQRFLLKRIELSEPLPEAAARKASDIFARVEGREITFEELSRVRAALNAMLLRDVDVLTYARIPPQDVKDGTVRFEVEHGHIAGVQFNNRSLVTDKVIKHYLPSEDAQAGKRDLGTLAQMNRRLSSLPGIEKAAVSLNPGMEPGTTTVSVDATPARRIEGALVANNAGSPSSGANMAGAQVNLNSPLGIGDRLQGTFFYAPPVGQGAAGRGGRTSYGVLSYDMPLGYQGVRGGVQYSRIDYKQGGPAELRDVFNGHGTADGVRAYITEPLRDRDDANFAIGGSVETRQLKDSFFELASRRRVIDVAVNTSGFKVGELAGRPNVSSLDAELKGGRVNIGEVGINDDATGDLTQSLIAGHFAKLSLNAQYQQLLRPGLGLSLKGSMQLASRHLDPSEQMSLGGSQAVRGYDSNLSSVDQGALFSAALTQDIKQVPGLSASGFYDYGRGQVSRSNIAAGGCGCAIPGNWLTVQSAGAGLNYQLGEKLSVGVSYARQIGRVPLGQIQRKRGQTWLNVKLAF